MLGDQETIIGKLLKQFEAQREALMKMIKDLEALKVKIDRLFPEQLDKRYIRFFEEKVKTATGLFNTLLDIRKELSKSLKDEIDMRRKLEGKDDEEEIEKILNIRAIAEKVEKMQKQRDLVVKDEELKKPEKATNNDDEATSDMH